MFLVIQNIIKQIVDLQSGGCGFESQPGLPRTKFYSAFHPSGVGKWVPAAAGKAKAGMAHSDCGWTCGYAGKTVKSLENTCIPERCGDSLWSVCIFTFTFASTSSDKGDWSAEQKPERIPRRMTVSSRWRSSAVMKLHHALAAWLRTDRSGGCRLWVALRTVSGASQKWWWWWFHWKYTWKTVARVVKNSLNFHWNFE